MIASAKAADGSYPVLIIRRNDVRKLLTMEECIHAVEHAFRLYGEGAVQPPLVAGTHLKGGGFHIKAGVLPFGEGMFYAAKTNSNFPSNRMKHGLPTIQGLVLLFDAECGMPLAVMDSIEITSLRTAAATAVAAKYLARRKAKVLTVIGCGEQSRYQAEALLAVLPINTAYAYDIDPARSKAFADEFQENARVATQSVSNFADATKASDVIVTCTTSTTAFLMPDHVRTGTFIAAVGADNEDKQELDPTLLMSNRVIPDVIAQAAFIGELHHALTARMIKLESVTTELGQIVAGKKAGRISDAEITIFDSTGMALQDVAAACAIYKKAQNSPAVSRLAINSSVG